MILFQSLMFIGYVFLRFTTLAITLKAISSGLGVETNPFMKDIVTKRNSLILNESIMFIIFLGILYFNFFDTIVWIIFIMFLWINFQHDFHVYFVTKSLLKQVNELELFDVNGNRVKLSG